MAKDKKSKFGGLLSTTKEKEEVKTMVEPSSNMMEEPIKKELEKSSEEMSVKEQADSVVKTLSEASSSKALSGHPIAQRKHQSMLSQKQVNARKYFKSK